VSYQQQGPYYGQQQGGYPQYPGGPPPRKNNTALLVAFGGVAVASVIALVLVLVLGKDGDSSGGGNGNSALPGKHGAGTIEVSVPAGAAPSGAAPSGAAPSGGGSSGGGGGARDLAERTAKAFEHLSSSEINQVSCSSSVGTELSGPITKLPASAQISVSVKDVQESGSSAQARMSMTISGRTADFSLQMKKSSSWCVSGVEKA
jgi:hypothetical protein